MTKTLLAMTATAALAAGSPALSQTSNTNMSARVDQLQTQIQTGVQLGQITRAEAQPLREQLRLLRQTERQYQIGGYSWNERQELQTRIRDLRAQIRYASRNDLTRYGAARWVDVNRDGWDDRDTNRDGILDTGVAMGGPYVPLQCERRTGIGGVIDTVLNRNSCLTVGQRATGNLYAVPYAYRNLYRDGAGVYYRSDGQQIYQIDARTNIVLQVFPLG